MPNISSDQIFTWIERFAAHIAEQKDYLTQLDAAIGDADHGANMHRGLQAVLAKKADLQNSDIGAMLKGVAMTLISTVGGASGALYGTFFLQASTLAGGRTELSPSEFGSVLEKGLAGIVLRGKAALGDKTMIDALQPAIKAYKLSIDSDETLEQALSKAVIAAEEGLKSTVPLVARKGRASYLGERSAGHPDPGATSTLILFRSAAETLG
ncbi:MAG: phosphoenolpyruvate---glycerone phosphotransferase subunit DhaL [Verrucomicrobiota bacterium]|jgi:dihydroxyacetone kinase-like protein|nr:phosphoenolpyruvate---glycerone phosphotransferase subunit DhaL [Verrucomicrobiota bacterium]